MGIVFSGTSFTGAPFSGGAVFCGMSRDWQPSRLFWNRPSAERVTVCAVCRR